MRDREEGGRRKEEGTGRTEGREYGKSGGRREECGR